MPDIEIIRKAIGDEILNFVFAKRNGKILLINMTQGVGKSTTAIKTLSENDIIFAFIGYNRHKSIDNLLKNKKLKHCSVKHIKGMNKKCDRADEIKMLIQKNVNPGFVCKGCKLKDDCKYLKQFKELEDNKQSFASVNAFLTHKLISEGNYDVLIIDENPITAFIKKTTFTIKNINTFLKVINLVEAIDVNSVFLQQSSQHLRAICETLKTMLTNMPQHKKGTPAKYITGKQFIDTFSKHTDIIKVHDLVVPRGKNGFTPLNVFQGIYNKFLQPIAYNETDFPNFKNMIFEIKQIIEMLYDNMGDKNFSVPIFLQQHIDNPSTLTLMHFNNNLPDKPIIILDATGNVKLYEQVFGIPVEEFNPIIDIYRNITQIDEGMYPRRSLKDKKIRTKVFNTCCATIKMWNRQGFIPFITTHKKFSRIFKDKESGEVINPGISIEEYLLKKGLRAGEIDDKGNVLKKGDFYVKYFEEMIGINLPVIKHYIIGTPWISDSDAIMLVSALFLGEKVLSAERYADGYTYKDERFGMHMRVYREGVLEQVAERSRFIFLDKNKEVILDTSIPIGFETNRIKRKDYMIKIGAYKPKDMTLQCLQWIQDKNDVSFNEFNDKFRNILSIKETGGAKVIRDRLIENKFVKVRKVKMKFKTKQILSVTSKGSKYLKNLKSMLERSVGIEND